MDWLLVQFTILEKEICTKRKVLYARIMQEDFIFSTS